MVSTTTRTTKKAAPKIARPERGTTPCRLYVYTSIEHYDWVTKMAKENECSTSVFVSNLISKQFDNAQKRNAKKTTKNLQ